MPVLEGKHIEPFIAHVEQSSQTIAETHASRLIDPARSFKRPRLAYRDVASSTNRVSLIAAILPMGVLTTHSLFCVKTFLGDDEQHYLCGMLNSFVANYLVRQVMTNASRIDHGRGSARAEARAEIGRVSGNFAPGADAKPRNTTRRSRPPSGGGRARV